MSTGVTDPLLAVLGTRAAMVLRRDGHTRRWVPIRSTAWGADAETPAGLCWTADGCLVVAAGHTLSVLTPWNSGVFSDVSPTDGSAKVNDVGSTNMFQEVAETAGPLPA